MRGPSEASPILRNKPQPNIFRRGNSIVSAKGKVRIELKETEKVKAGRVGEFDLLNWNFALEDSCSCRVRNRHLKASLLDTDKQDG